MQELCGTLYTGNLLVVLKEMKMSLGYKFSAEECFCTVGEHRQNMNSEALQKRVNFW
jgi:hypothetical protein